MGFDGCPEVLVLLSELNMVVQDLLLLFRCKVVNVNDDLTLAEKRKGSLLEIISCPLVNVVA